MLIPLARLVLEYFPNDVLLQQRGRHQESTQVRRVISVGYERTRESSLCLFSPNDPICVTPLEYSTVVTPATLDLRFAITKPQTSRDNCGLLAAECVGDVFSVFPGTQRLETFERAEQEPLKRIKDACFSGPVWSGQD